MFKKFVSFEIEKKDTTIIVDEFSKYTRDLTIQDGCLADRNIYCVVLKPQGLFVFCAKFTMRIMERETV